MDTHRIYTTCTVEQVSTLSPVHRELIKRNLKDAMEQNNVVPGTMTSISVHECKPSQGCTLPEDHEHWMIVDDCG